MVSTVAQERYEHKGEIREGEMLDGSLEAVRDPSNPRIAIIRTSDRITFKACRRRWGWSSHLRHNLGPISAISPLWFGSGIHFALEDFHGYNRFGHPKTAFMAYVDVRRKIANDTMNPDSLPDDIEELVELGKGMMDYYVLWLQQRANSLLRTYWHNGEPQVEINFRFPIPWEPGRFGLDEVYYSGTIDRVCIDEYGMLWPLDYKTAKIIQVLHYLTDPQINAYMWAAPHIYDKPIGGFIYQQHRKAVPNPGKILVNGSISVAQNQGTTHLMYRQTLIDHYGEIGLAPVKNQEFLNDLARFESEMHDDYVRIDKINRNARNAESEGTKILMEIEDMLNPDLPLYPNPTRDCSGNFACPFLSPCVSMDDGGDWRHELEMTTMPRDKEYDSWRKQIVWPSDKKEEPKPDDRSWLDV